MNQENNCQVCLNNYTMHYDEDKFRPIGICYNCWLQHVKTNITKISYKIGSNLMSPFQNQQSIDIGLVLQSLQYKNRKEIEQWLFKKYTTFTHDIEKCPSQTCNFVFIMEKCNWFNQNDEKCPKCLLSLNSGTKIGLTQFLGYIYFIIFASRCPSCEIPIARISGCPHMTCPCGHQFCWYCLKDYSYGSRSVYSYHEANQCAFILISKIVIFLMCFIGLLIASLGSNQYQQLIYFAADWAYFSIGILWGDAFLALNVLILFVIEPYIYFKVIAIICDIIIFFGVYYFDLIYPILIYASIEVVIFGMAAIIFFLNKYFIDTWASFIM